MSNSDTKKNSTVLITVMVASFIPCALFNGYVISKLWEWFVMPLANVKSLGIFQAVGLQLLSHLLIWIRYPQNDSGKTKSEIALDNLANVWVKPFVALVIGWGCSWLV